jgi:hypothetical protein
MSAFFMMCLQDAEELRETCAANCLETVPKAKALWSKTPGRFVESSGSRHDETATTASNPWIYKVDYGKSVSAQRAGERLLGESEEG